jgi:hypothetical protein
MAGEEVVGLGPEDPAADIAATATFIVGGAIGFGVGIWEDSLPGPLPPTTSNKETNVGGMPT